MSTLGPSRDERLGVAAGSPLPGLGRIGGFVCALAIRIRQILTASDDRATMQRTAALAFAIRVLNAAVVYLSQILLARWMGSFEFGIYAFVWVWVTILGPVAVLGLDTTLLRYVPEYAQARDNDRLRGILFGSRTIVFAVSTVLATAGAAGVYFFEDAIASYYVLPIYLAFICCPIFALTGVQEGIARAHNWIALALSPSYLVRPLLVLGLLALAHTLGFEPTASTAVLATIVAVWVAGIWQLLVLNRRLGRIVPKGARRHETKQWLAVSMPLMLVEGFYLLLTNMDVLMLSHFVSPDKVAIYFAATKTLSLVSFISFSVTAASTHRFSHYNAAGDHDGLAAFVRHTIAWTFWPSLAATALILAAGYPLLWMFGSDFTSGYPLMFILAVGLLIRAAVGPIEHVLNMLGHQMVTGTVLFATLLLNMAFNMALIPVLGLAGAALATTLAVMIASILFFVQARRRVGLHIFIWEGKSQ